MPASADGGAATLDRTADTGAPTDPVDAKDYLAGVAPSRGDVLVAGLIALAVIIVAVIWRSPIIPTDPWHYVQRAITFPDRVWVPLGYTRYGIILPNILPAKLFGNAQASFYFWPLISAGVLAAVVYLLGRRWWGPVAGVVAVVVLFTNTLVFQNLTRQYPDIMAMTLVLSAAFAALMARDRGFRGRAAVAWVLVAGFLLGWSFEVRETALFAWPLVIVMLWRRGSVLRVMALAALPVLAWALLDIAIGAVAYDDWLIKLHTFMGFGGGPPQPGSAAETALNARTRAFYLDAIPQGAATRPDGVWMLVTGAVAILAVAVRNWPLRLMSLSLISVLALNLLAGGVLFPARPFGDIFNTRYWIQYIPMLALIIGGLTGLLTAWLSRSLGVTSKAASFGLAAAVGLTVCAVPVWTTARWVPTVEAFAPNGGDALEDLRTHLDAIDFSANELWTDWETRRLVPVYQRGFFGGERVWTGTPKSLTGPGEPAPGDHVLLYSRNGATCGHCRTALAPWSAEHPTLPASWQLVYEDDAGAAQLYRVR